MLKFIEGFGIMLGMNVSNLEFINNEIESGGRGLLE